MQVARIGGNPDRPAVFFRPNSGGRKVAECLADPRARLRQREMRTAFAGARGEDLRHLGSIGALARALLSTFSGEPRQLCLHRLW